MIVKVNHDYFGGRVELRRQKRRQSHGTSTCDRDPIAGLNLAIEDAALKARWEDVTQHDQGFFIGIRRNGIKAGIGVRDSHKFRLRTVDGIAQNPAPGFAVRIHSPTTVITHAARRNAGNKNAVTLPEAGHRSAHVVNDADALMSENASTRARGYIAFEYVKIRPANGCPGNPHDCVRNSLNDGFGSFQKRFLARSLKNKSFHLFTF